MSVGPWQLAVLLIIVVLIFGTKRLKSMGSDLGGAVKGFKKSMAEDETQSLENSKGETIEGEAKSQEKTESKD